MYEKDEENDKMKDIVVILSFSSDIMSLWDVSHVFAKPSKH